MRATVRHVAKSPATGLWQAYAKRSDGVEAIFHARTRTEAVQAAVDWVGAETLLDASLDALDEILGVLRG